MKPLFICYDRCSTCQRAKKWLDDRQAAYDARVVKQLYDSGAEYFASWGYMSGPNTFFEGLPSVSFHVARHAA